LVVCLGCFVEVVGVRFLRGTRPASHERELWRGRCEEVGSQSPQATALSLEAAVRDQQAGRSVTAAQSRPLRVKLLSCASQCLGVITLVWISQRAQGGSRTW